MKAQPVTLLLAAWMTIPGLATSVGLSSIEQPVNLCAESDPSRIPLGRVAVESNYHYGRGPVITAPRPSLHGPMIWKSGSELDQNLASVFGIEVSNHDIPYAPATIRLKARPIPPYSPYSKEQVLAATIHCLLRSNRGTPKQPIVLKVEADAKDDEALARKYAGTYINSTDLPDPSPSEPTPVPGTRLETDARGVTWVVFPDVRLQEKPHQPSPALIPFRLGGEFGSADAVWQLLPVWSGTGRTLKQSLEVIGRPYPLFYDCYNPSTGSGPETNAMFVENPHGALFSLNIDISDNTALHAGFRYPGCSTETLAATILALAVSVQPTAQRPLVVTLETMTDSPPQWFAAFAADSHWTGRDGSQKAAGKVIHNHSVLSCSFVWDPETTTFAQGGVPAANVVRTSNGELLIEASPINEKPADIPAPK